MADPRLTTALRDGTLLLPEGEITVLRPPADWLLADLPKERVRIVTGFYPDHASWKGRGYAVSRKAGPAAAAMVIVPRSKPLARALIAEAAATAPLVIVDGQRTDGTDSLFKEVRARRGDAVQNVAKAHGRLFWFEGGAGFEDWAAPEPQAGPEGFVTAAGVFSADGPDKGSVLLAQALPAKLPTRMADLGAGWGYLSRAVLERQGVNSLDLVEAEADALDCARLNVTDDRARFHWHDALGFKPEEVYNGIVMNPPFHQGRVGDPSLGRGFIAAAARMLTGSGQLWLVANRHLPYEAELKDRFRDVTEIGADAGFKILHAARPNKRA
ncbi:class I SAM-dependent methyltransferase [Pseudoroseicyclus aestuarii]|uniref:16S rRNA m(2)G 1207 methyltransferase n=1 Tax=Pseudoroseicyclus aestuarii TaxID=1795041 RepID=A0A318SSU4_9RHOB|nr:methyltransferase [Pseudoroseicyclus aestuarii]PYE85011.1 16S rRNA m(2)G 1207 methyltransferase [Pseudoroseicyclus aestuarii]